MIRIARLSVSRFLRHHPGAALVAVCAVVSACGGGGSPEAPSTPARDASLGLLAGSVGGAGNLDGPAGAARFDLPAAAVATPDGDIFVADSANHAIRRIDRAGNVTTFAGRIGEAGDADGTGATARFRAPSGLAIDASFLYVADHGNRMVRRIRLSDAAVDTLAGQASPNTTAAADGTGGRFGSARFTSPTALALGPGGDVFVADDAAIRRVSGTTSVTTVAGRLNSKDCGSSTPTADVPADTTICRVGGLAFRSGDTSLYFTDPARKVVRAVQASGGVLGAPSASRIRFVAGSPSGKAATVDGVGPEALFVEPESLVATAEGELIVGQRAALRLVRLSSEGDRVDTLAGSKDGQQGNADGPRATARFGPFPAVFARGSTLVIADRTNHLVRTFDRETQRVATRAGQRREAGSADGGQLDARFFEPVGISLSSDGSATLVDAVAASVRLVATSSRQVTTLAVAPPADQDMSPASVVASDSGQAPVIASLGDHSIRTVIGGALTLLAGSGSIDGSGLIDGPGPLARFDSPQSIVRDADGSLLVADRRNHRIRVVAQNGQTGTWAGGVPGFVDGPLALARFNEPIGLARSSDGTLYVLEAGNRAVRRVVRGAQGETIVSTFAQGLPEPTAIAVDDAGSVYVVHGSEHTVRRYRAGQSQGEVIVGAVGRCGFVPGPMPGVICRPRGIAVRGDRMVMTMEQGVIQVEPLPR